MARGDDAPESARWAHLELTVKGLIVGLALALLLGAANMYVGMRVGLTVSASIPAAVLSLAILRSFKRRSIKENNIAQTIASAAESLAAGVIFTIPALLPAFLGVWEDVHLVETALIALTGGLLGVLFAVPLRKALIVDRELPYPEGVACAAVLRTGHGAGGAKLLLAGALTGAIFAFLQLGLSAFPTTAETATFFGDVIAFVGTDLSLILIGVGFLVGLRIASYIFAGGAFAWFFVLPLLSGARGSFDVPDLAGLGAVDAASTIWDAKIRLIGAGAMFTGGLLAVWHLRGSLATAAREGLRGYGKAGEGTGDMPFKFIVLGVAVLLVPLALLTSSALPELYQGLFTVVFVVIAGFLLSAVAGYMAGVVGSSNNPISGVTILALATTAGLLKLFGVTGEAGILGALFVGALIATSAAISGDTMQDLKTGHMVEATPWKQQLGQMLGVGIFAFVAPFVLVLLDRAFTIGSQTLPAPQAGLMSAFLNGFFGEGVDVLMLGSGAVLGAVAAALSIPVLPVAVGIYLPLGLSAPIFIGGVLRHGVKRQADKRGADAEAVEQRGTLLASGLIAGEAVAGIVLAGLIVRDASVTPVGNLTFVLSPLVLGVLAGLAALVVGGGRRWARPVAAGLLLAGIAGTLWATGDALPSLDGGPLVGLAVMAYGALVVTYLALRPQLADR